MAKKIKYESTYHAYPGDIQHVNGTPSSRHFMLLAEGTVWDKRNKTIFKVDWTQALRVGIILAGQCGT